MSDDSRQGDAIDQYDKSKWRDPHADIELNIHMHDQNGHYVVEYKRDGETRKVGSGVGLTNALEDLSDEIWKPALENL